MAKTVHRWVKRTIDAIARASARRDGRPMHEIMDALGLDEPQRTIFAHFYHRERRRINLAGHHDASH